MNPRPPPNEPAAGPPLVEIGVVMRPVGVRGEVWVDLHAASPAPHHQQRLLYLRGAPQEVEHAKPRKGGMVLKLRGVDTPEQAGALRGLPVEVPQSALAPTPEDTYYHSQVLGLRAVTTDGREIGTVSEILEMPSNDVYVATGPLGEVLIPAIGDVVKEVDLERGILVVEPVPGLLEP